MSEKIIACNLTLGEINGLAETLGKNHLERIKIKSGDGEIVIESARKCSPPPIPFLQGSVPEPVRTADEKSSSPAAEESGNVIKSPIVGTFYASPSPDKPPFVKIGDTVKKGDVIMIIESMKLMNEVQSEFDGTVEQILVSDGQAVEYDQPIMIIK